MERYFADFAKRVRSESRNVKMDKNFNMKRLLMANEMKAEIRNEKTGELVSNEKDMRNAQNMKNENEGIENQMATIRTAVTNDCADNPQEVMEVAPINEAAPCASEDESADSSLNECCLDPRIVKYISKVETIEKGARNAGLYELGLCLRGNFGLFGDLLEAALQDVNRTKCAPALAESEVKEVVCSVDKAKNVPLGEPGTVRKPKGKMRTHAPKYRTVNIVSVSDVTTSVADLLEKEVSTYDSCRENMPSGTYAIGAMLEAFKGKEAIKTQVAEIRAESDKERRSELKKSLPAVVFGSEPQTERNNASCTPNGVLCLDFDNIAAEELEAAKQAITAVPYVFAVGLSVSGGGLFALVHYEGTPDLKALLAAMQADFGYEIDKSRSDLAGLRYITFDENLVVKDDVSPVILTERQELVDGVELAEEIVSCGIEALDNVLANIVPVDWDQYQTEGRGGEIKPPSERDYLLRTSERVLHTADRNGTPLVNHADCIHYYTGTHYAAVGKKELQNFLIEAAIRCGVPSDVAVYQFFAEKIVKQFMINSARHSSRAAEPDTTYINLKNGTLFFNGKERRFEAHLPERFIRYCLHFDYSPEATAPLWQTHLERALPNSEKQWYLAKCLALPFYPGKIEKASVFFGARDTGKSTTLDVFKSLLGSENYSTESLAALTKEDNQGAYARARLDGKLVNIASDISAKISDDGMAKTLISREAVSARHPYGHGFDMQKYGRMSFAMNNLPPQFFTDAALTKRIALIHFDQQIKSGDIDTNFTDKIIENELPGVLNWIISGLDLLLLTGRLDPPSCCIAETEQLRTVHDPLSAWLARWGWEKGESKHILLGIAYDNYVKFCKSDGYQALSKNSFTKRLREAGYKIDRRNGHIGTVLYYSKSVSNSHSPQSPHSPALVNKDEDGDQAGNDEGQSGDAPTSDIPLFPVHSPLVPVLEPTNTGTGIVGNDGTENSDLTFDGEEREYLSPGTDTSRQAAEPPQASVVEDYFAVIPSTQYPKHGCDFCQFDKDGSSCDSCPWTVKTSKNGLIHSLSAKVEGVTYSAKSCYTVYHDGNQ